MLVALDHIKDNGHLEHGSFITCLVQLLGLAKIKPAIEMNFCGFDDDVAKVHLRFDIVVYGEVKYSGHDLLPAA